MFRQPFESIRGHMIFMPPLRDSSPVVLDLGSNRGEFSSILQARFGGIYRLFEPNPDLAESTPLAVGMTIERCAVAGDDEVVDLNIARNNEGSSLLELPPDSVYDCVAVGIATVSTLSLDTVLAGVADPIVDLIKMDIEGSEVVALQAVSTPTLARRVRQLAIEFHSAPVFGFDLATGVMEVTNRLESAGFVRLDFSPRGDQTDVLFVNRKLIGAGNGRLRAYQAWARYFYPFVHYKRAVGVRRRRFYDRLRFRSVLPPAA